MVYVNLDDDRLIFDIRHTSNLEETIYKEDEIDIREKTERVMIEIPAVEVFYQMMISKLITNEDYIKMRNRMDDIAKLREKEKK